MKMITHKQARRFMRADLDGLLTDAQSRDLAAHLDECEACRLESESLSSLTAHLQTGFHAKWDTQHGPSHNVMANIHSQTRRIVMSNRINIGFRTLASVAALIVLGFVISTVASQMRNTSTAANGTQIVSNTIPAKELPLIVFSSENKPKRNMDIFTMHMDGSDITNLTNNPANDTFPAWSPDGKKIVFTSERAGNANIFVMNPDGSGVTQLTDNPGYDGNIYGNISWSHDGQKIVYSAITNDPNAESQLMIMNADGSNKTTLTKETGSYVFLSWSPDGQKVIYQKDSVDPNGSSANTVIYSVNIDGTDQRELFKGGGILSMRWDDAGNFSGIVYTQLENGNRYLYRFNLDGTPAERLGSSPTPIDGWLTEGSKTIYITKNKTTWFWHDNQKNISEWPKWNFASSCKDYSPKDVYQHDAVHVMSPDGKHLFVTVTCNEGVSHFYLVSADGSEIKELANMPTPISWEALFPTWSPDGKYIIITSAVAEPSNESAYMDFYLFDIEKMLNDPSTQPIQLTTDKAFKFSPGWQPIPNNDIVEEKPTPEPTQTLSQDGLIAFTSQKNNNVEIYTMRADGSNVINLTNNSANNYGPAWSPDGKSIAFTSDRTDQTDHTGNVDIFVMNSDGKELTQLTDTPGYDAFLSWSPDGQKIVVQSNEGGHLSTKGQMIVMNPDGSNKIALTKEIGSYSFLSWSPDRQKIVYQKYQPDPNINVQNAGVYIADMDGANQYKLATKIGAEKIHWQDSEHFLGVSFQQKPEEQPEWSLYRFSADGSLPLKLSSYSTPIVAIFDETYAVEGQNALLWYSIEGDHTLLSPPSSSWSFSEICKTPSDRYMEDTQHFISPDGKYAFVTVHCWEGLFWSYLESADGSEITQLTGMSTFSPSELRWSPDGKFIVFTIDSTSSETPSSSIYFLELRNILEDSSAKPVQLAVDSAWSAGAVWQPRP